MDPDDAPTEPLPELPTAPLTESPIEPLSAQLCSRCQAGAHIWGKRVTESFDLPQPGHRTGWQWIGLKRAVCACGDCAETCKAEIVTIDLTRKDVSMTAPTVVIPAPLAGVEFSHEQPSYELMERVHRALQQW